MKILSVDSSAKSASVAIYDEKIISEFFINTNLTHSQTLVPMLDSALKNASLSVDDIDCFAVNVGPGSFTGVRIGVSAVKGIAFAKDKPCVAVSTLESIAYNFTMFENAVICACMDARRNQFYNALFKIENGMPQRLCEDRAVSCEDLSDEIKDFESVIIAGDGAELFYNLAKDMLHNIVLSSDNLRYQRASSVASCAKRKYDNNEVIKAEALMPSYLRLSQAEREYKNKQGDNTK